jgi:hypothetical protein
VEIDSQIEAVRPQSSRERDVRHRPADAATAWSDDHVIEMRVVENYGRGVRLDDVADVRVWISPPQRPNGWRREDHVANLAQANQKYSHRAKSFILNRGLIDQHHGNVVLDRIHTIALRALQCCAVLHERHRCFAVGARENLEQFRVDRHATTI